MIRPMQHRTGGTHPARIPNRIVRLLFLCLATVLTLFPVCMNVNAASSGATALKIYEGQFQRAEPFAAVNMFPGDSVTKAYDVEVSHHGNVNLRFHADIHPGYEKLAEVLKCTVYIEGRQVYDGLMRDMPSQINNRLYTSTGTTTTQLYVITVYLDTSVGNPYQNQALYADFRWWVEESHYLSENPKTSDPAALGGYIALCIGSMSLIWLLYRRKRKEDAQ